MYPRRLGAWRWEAVPSLRPVNTERAETQRHGGFQKLACTHLCNIPPDFIVLDKARRCTKREGRACRVRLRNADAAHAQVWQRPMWLRRPEYRATPQSVFAKLQGGSRRGRRVGGWNVPFGFPRTDATERVPPVGLMRSRGGGRSSRAGLRENLRAPTFKAA